MKIISEKHPKFLVNNKLASVLIAYQMFIELIRENKELEALEVAHKYFSDVDYETNPQLHHIMGLLSLKNPKESTLGYLFQESHREYIADQINISLLEYFGGKSKSSLEEALLQMVQVYKHLNISSKILKGEKLE